MGQGVLQEAIDVPQEMSWESISNICKVNLRDTHFE